MVRMLIVGYCYSIRAERRLCQEVKANLVYRWFCGLGRCGSAPTNGPERIHNAFS